MSKSVDMERYYLIEDSTTRESFQQIYDNTRNLQTQMDEQIAATQKILDEHESNLADAATAIEATVDTIEVVDNRMKAIINAAKAADTFEEFKALIEAAG